MSKSATRGKISPLGLFYILFICRIVVSLTSTHSVSKTEINSQALISYILAILLTVVFSLPAIFCCKKGKNPIDVKCVSKFYYAYFLIVASVSVSRFSYFASTTLNPETQGWLFALIVCTCAFYGAFLGIEALSRFSAFCFVLLSLAVVSVILCNFDTFREINLYPIITFSKFDLIKNAVVYASNTSEIAMFLAIFPKVNGRCERTYIRSVCLSFLTVFILLYFATAVMGKSAVIRNFPFYSFFQISKFGTFERLDVLHISFWIMGVFVKAVTSLYCASSCISKKPKRSFVFASSFIVFVISILMLKLSGGQGVNYEFTMILFFAFCVIIPFGTLVFKKKNYGDELVKAY